MNLILFDRETGKEITDGDKIMKMSDIDSKMHYEAFGVQSDGQPVVFDTCGNFGYLDINKVRVTIDL